MYTSVDTAAAAASSASHQLAVLLAMAVIGGGLLFLGAQYLWSLRNSSKAGGVGGTTTAGNTTGTTTGTTAGPTAAGTAARAVPQEVLERRLALRGALGELLATAAVRGRLTAQEGRAWQALAREAEALFGEPVARHLGTTVWALLQELTVLQEQSLWESVSSKLGTGAKGSQALQGHAARKQDVLAEQEALDGMLAPFLP